jgi:hypothetical protein
VTESGTDFPWADATLANEGSTVTVVTFEEFAAKDEEGAEALVGTGDDALIAANGDAMFYGDGGAGKTTLAIDLACHLAAGDDWLEIPVPRAVRVLLIEREGPRPLLRRKARRKLAGWTGSKLEGRVRVWEAPWASFTFADIAARRELADLIRSGQIDVVIVGPLNRVGMNEAGTLQEVRDFSELINETRRLAERLVAVLLVHHENKGGKVSAPGRAPATPSSMCRPKAATARPASISRRPDGRPPTTPQRSTSAGQTAKGSSSRRARRGRSESGTRLSTTSSSMAAAPGTRSTRP